MRADRLLALVLQLQAQGRSTGRELAEKLEISERTVHRDMEALSAAGVPVFAIRGVRGGWQLDPEWRTSVPGLDDAELHALLMIQPRSMGDSRIAASATSAFNKLLAAMPNSLRDRAAVIQKRLYVDPMGWWGVTEELSFLPVVQSALLKDRKLSIAYQRQDGKSSVRIVDPLGLVAKGMSWYLVADSANGLRTFRLSRIQDAQILEMPCARPHDFDLEKHWKQSTASFKESRSIFKVTLDTDSKTAESIRKYCRPAREEVTKKKGKDVVVMELGFGDEEEARFIIMGLGCRVNVIQPEKFSATLAAEVAQIFKRNSALHRKDRASHQGKSKG